MTAAIEPPRSPAPDPSIEVTVCLSPGPRRVWEWTLRLPVDTSVAAALADPVVAARLRELGVDASTVGIWGRKVTPEQTLRDGDRLEMYRPLTVDPKLARRERFRRQGGARATGLFARPRPAGKPGG